MESSQLSSFILAIPQVVEAPTDHLKQRRGPIHPQGVRRVDKHHLLSLPQRHSPQLPREKRNCQVSLLCVCVHVYNDMCARASSPRSRTNIVFQKNCPINPGHSALQANALPAELDNSGVQANLKTLHSTLSVFVHSGQGWMGRPDTTLSECVISAVLYGVVTAQFGHIGSLYLPVIRL